MEDEKKHLVFAIMHFLEQELLRSDLTPDSKESLEVGIQCLENVYEIFSSDPAVKAKYPMPASLVEIWNAGYRLQREQNQPAEVSQEDKALADQHKTQGNEHMKAENFGSAVEQYSKAIEIDSLNAVYYCNRAAAYSKMSEHSKALEDCMQALIIDPKYSKAYGRKGLAHSALNQYADAKLSFERALEHDPDNDSYKKNLEVAEQKLAEQATGVGGMPGIPGMPGGLGANMAGLGGFANMLNNPALMNMATQMMQSPQMQNMMANLMSGMQGGEQPDMSNLLQAGQEFAQHMNEQNPELVEQLRRSMGQVDTGDQPAAAQQPEDASEEKNQ